MWTDRRLTRLRGLRWLARALAWELYAALIDQATALRSHQLPEPPLRLQLGSGPNVRSGWVNIDLDRRADLTLDLRERFPLPDGCVEVIAAEHTFEHLEHPYDTRPFLRECLRLLEPGGVLALSVPDAEEGLRRYAADDRAWFAWAQARWRLPAQHSFTPLAAVNYGFRQGTQHRYAYDAETLIAVLTAAGFAGAYVRDFDPEFDTEDRRLASLRVTAHRP